MEKDRERVNPLTEPEGANQRRKETTQRSHTRERKRDCRVFLERQQNKLPSVIPLIGQLPERDSILYVSWERPTDLQRPYVHFLSLFLLQYKCRYDDLMSPVPLQIKNNDPKVSLLICILYCLLIKVDLESQPYVDVIYLRMCFTCMIMYVRYVQEERKKSESRARKNLRFVSFFYRTNCPFQKWKACEKKQAEKKMISFRVNTKNARSLSFSLPRFQG